MTKLASHNEVTRIQELIFELSAGTAMSKHIFTIERGTTMREVQMLFKEKHITGVPVVNDGDLIGIISLEDFIKWLADGSVETYVSERMTTNVVTVFADEPLVNAVRTLEKYGFGRLPVLDRGNGKLVGIVTKADIIQALLLEPDTDFRAEESRSFKRPHLFDDILANEMELRFRYTIKGGPIESGGTVASAIKKTVSRLGVNSAVARRISIAAYEAEMNVTIYAGSGSAEMTIDSSSITVEVTDSGPGIPDIEAAMQPGYSTAPAWVCELGFGAGMGLANICSSSDEMQLTSEPGRGTTLVFSVGMVQA